MTKEKLPRTIPNPHAKEYAGKMVSQKGLFYQIQERDVKTNLG